MTPFRRALADAIEGRTKVVACEAFPQATESTAKAELSKIISGERGESVFRVMEAVFKFGDRAKLRLYFDERLREVSPTQIADAVTEIGEQLGMIFDRLEEVRREMAEQAEVIPMRRRG